jgi:hypothetical protein
LMRNCLCLNIVLGLDTSTPVSTGGKHRGDKGSSGGRGLTVCC